MAAFALTDAEGRFRLHNVPKGSHRLDVRHAGHEPYSAFVTVGDGDSVSIVVRLRQLAVALPTVAITAPGDEVLPFELRDFQRRRAISSGKFFSRREIEATGAQTLESLLRARVGGFSFVRLPNGGTALAGKRTTDLSLVRRRQRVEGLEDRCYVQVFINGQKVYQYTAPPDPPPSLEDFRIDDISAIELYRGAAETPTELSGNSASCGTLSIWNNVAPTNKR